MTGRLAVPRIRFGLGIVIVAIALFVASTAIRAQQQGGTDLSQQLQLFNSLPEEQQQQLMQRFTGGDSSGLGLSSGSGLGGMAGMGLLGTGQGLGLGSGLNSLNSSQSVLLEQMQLQQQRRLQSRQQYGTSKTYGLNGLNYPEKQVFKPGDTVLVTVELLRERNSSAGSQGSTTSADASQNNSLNPEQLQQQALGSEYNTRRVQEAPQRTIEELQAEEKQNLQDLIDHIRLHNPYEIDRNGELRLPGVSPIGISGLTEDLATRRVAADPAFAKLQILLTRLPVEKSGKDALKPFGYDLFENSMVGLLPTLNLPAPADYIVGPGDTLQVQLYGSTNQQLRLVVGRDGSINFPQLGPIQVAGQRFTAMQADVENRVSRQMIGTQASVTLGDMRTVTVFVTGSANYPGSYSVSSQATVTTALFAAGGVQPKGSLRSIQLKRQGELVRTFDLYDLLMRGDSSNDAKLQAGDVVFIPPVGPTAAVDGEIQRPAIYEIKGIQSVADLIRMGGGLTADADASAADLLRVDAEQRRLVVKVSPAAASAAAMPLRNGDLLEISPLRPQLDSGVVVNGHLYRPKNIAWHEGMRLSEVFPTLDELMPDSDQHYVLIRREMPPNRKVVVLSADLAAALHRPGSAADIMLSPRDQITVFDKESSRAWVIQPLLNDLRQQANVGEPTAIVHVEGQIQIPGEYPLEQGMRVSDLLRAGGGLNPSAYAARAELARYTTENGDQRNTSVIDIDLSALKSGDPAVDLLLQPFDRLSVKQISGWTEQDQVQLKGEVRFPGTYAIRPGETLSSVIQRAGGLTQFAFVDGSLFTRSELKVREQEQLDRLANRLRTEIAEVALMGVRAQQGSAVSSISIGETLLRQLTDAKAVGRLVIDLHAVIANKPGSPEDVILRNGDQLIVPKKRQEVMVLGEVQDPTSHLYQRDMSRDDYIDQSGGATRQADMKRVYVVRANGSVDSGNRGWFHNGGSVRIRPGDAIVVPLDTERLPPLTLYTAVSTILYNIAIAVAEAKNTF